MSTATLATSVQIGEILVPGATSLHGAKTFMLTRPSGGPHGVEIAFGLFSGETQKRVIDRLADRLVEELRPVIFADGTDEDARFEAALKRANSVILGFLHEHGLSLPGIKLRGSFGLLAGDRLNIASRGALRGTVVVPQSHNATLAPFTLFEEGSDSLTHPKFFSSFQGGTLPPGARLYVSSVELFQATDEAFAISRFTDPDSSRSIRELKNALKASRQPVSVLTLAIPRPDMVEEMPRTFNPQPAPVVHRPEAKYLPPQPKANLADVGDLVSRGLRSSVSGATVGLRSIPKGLAIGGRALFSGGAMIVNGFSRIGSGALSIFRSEDGRFRISTILSLPHRAMETGVDGLNLVPRHRVAHFVALFLIVNISAHAAVFSLRRQALVGDVRAYENQLSEVQQIETDLESSLIYGDEARAKELAAQLDSKLGALPQSTDAQKAGIAMIKEELGASLARMHRTVAIQEPTVFASLDVSNKPKAMAWWNGGLYAFSSDKAAASAVGADGTVAPAEITGLNGPVLQAVPATTGVMVLGSDGSLALWNPGSGVQKYSGATFANSAQILFYQGRVYNQEAGAIVRRSVKSQSLATPVTVVQASAVGSAISGLAANGALYTLTSQGAVSRFVKGNADANFHRAQVEPAPTQATDLVIASNRLAYIDKGNDRVIVIDGQTGNLVAQATSPAFKNLQSLTFDDGANRLLVLNGDGKVFALALARLKP